MTDTERLQKILSRERIAVSQEEFQALLETREMLRREMGLLGRLWNWLGMRLEDCRRYVGWGWGIAILEIQMLIAGVKNRVERLLGREVF